MDLILKKLRKDNRYSQQQIANIIGVSRQAYIKYESGNASPSAQIIKKLSRIYNVSCDYLLGDNDAYCVASPEPAYCASSVNLMSQLESLQAIISSIQKSFDFSKSKKFDKDAFFKAIGKVTMDGSYVKSLREESIL